MHFFRNKTYLITTLGLFFLLGCVTVNIYFPAEKVESVADQIVNDVRGDQDSELEEDTQSRRRGGKFLALLVSPAWAQGDAVSVSNPTIRALKASMRERFPKLRPHYRKGRITEQDNGYLSLESTENLGLKAKRNLKNLVEAENNDRERLYTEVARAMKLEPSQKEKVAEVFAKKWQESAP